jgi:hypothetical protein
MEAIRIYPQRDQTPWNNNRGIFVRTCMGAKGYEFSGSSTECHFTTEILENPDCYQPMSFMGRIFLKIELMLEDIFSLPPSSSQATLRWNPATNRVEPVR